MFKGTEPTKYIALAYLTGILPIKKLKTQSALNNFEEFTMLDAERLHHILALQMMRLSSYAKSMTGIMKQ